MEIQKFGVVASAFMGAGMLLWALAAVIGPMVLLSKFSGKVPAIEGVIVGTVGVAFGIICAVGYAVHNFKP